jgi:hypothetical protein
MPSVSRRDVCLAVQLVEEERLDEVARHVHGLHPVDHHATTSRSQVEIDEGSHVYSAWLYSPSSFHRAHGSIGRGH